MSSCCSPDEYARLFTTGEARRSVKRYLRRGLTGTAAQLAQAVTSLGVQGATILEVGGGAGTIQAELLRSGAARAVNVELSRSWEPAAGQLLTELGLGERVERRLGDFVVEAPGLGEADVVLLHRVVCCYPGWRPMLAASRRLSRRVVGLTFPVDRWWTRSAIRAGNLLLRISRRGFRAFVHPAEAMIADFTANDFDVVYDRAGGVWRTVVAVRTGS